MAQTLITLRSNLPTRPGLVGFFAVLFAGLFSIAVAAPITDNALQSQQKDLRQVRERIEALRKELSTNETARKKAQDEVRQTQGLIEKLKQELDTISRNRTNLESRLRDLKAQSDALTARIRTQQLQLEQTLFNQYVAGTSDPVQNLLNADNPAQSARDSYYLTQIAQNRTLLLTNFKQDLAVKKQVTADLEGRTKELNELLTQQQQKQAELLKHRDRHQELVAALSGKVEKQKQEMTTLQQSEKRLTALVDKLLADIAERRAKQKRAEEDARKSAAKPTPGKPTPPAPRPSNPELTGLPSGLKLPVQGLLAGRFGSARPEGGIWKGILIKANRGTPVKAIATGEVVYADFMRGFGNLLILDHGNGYLSIYGHNDGLAKRTGETVKNGETIASVGSNGPDQDYGLYFEIRHQGKPLDPLKWASQR